MEEKLVRGITLFQLIKKKQKKKRQIDIFTLFFSPARIFSLVKRTFAI